MAFNLSERFLTAKQSYQLLDPGSYQNTNSLLIKPNKVPFLSKTSRNSHTCDKLWTHAIYYGDVKPKIPNCTSISSKVPRFSYENINNINLQPLVCQCGIQNTCECFSEKEKADHQEETICQTTVRRRLFKGPNFRSILKERFTTLRKDKGFKILPNGSKEHIFKQTKEDHPPFYDARVVESNAFYRGCKWSRWTSQRCNYIMSINQNPGPTDYKIDENQPSYEVICTEKLRALKRKTCKQLRYIEFVQRQSILEALPGPDRYKPVLPKGTDLKFVGPKAARFIIPKNNETPKPTTYSITRDFDVNKSCFKPCLANLPSRAPFLVKARRLQYRCEEGPSPFSYNLNNMSCQQKYHNTAPFGSYSKRFSDSCEKTQDFYDNNIDTDTVKKPCRGYHLPTWEFRSKTIRMKPIIKINNVSSPPLDLLRGLNKRRLFQFQYICPFFSSEARFQNWFNWISVQGNEKTPGPTSYNIEKGKCLPAVKSGPINRSERFTTHDPQTPAPNTYKIIRELDNIPTTHNQRLKNNVKNKHKYIWKEPVERRRLSLDEQEIMLLNKSIALLDVPDVFEHTHYENKRNIPLVGENKTEQSKLLRCFVYAKKVEQYF